jgi:peptide/nickel transport system permease protein
VATVWLPALVLGLAGVNGRPLRALLVVQMQAEPARALRARGASGRFILLRFALPNAMVAYLGMIGLSVGAIIGGDVIVESVFSWPGLGGLAVTAVMQRDMPLVQSYVVLTTLAYVLASMLCDLVADLADPRRTDLGRF